jgi:hypothetical protein
MEAIIRTYYPDNKLQEELDLLGFSKSKILFTKVDVLEAVSVLLDKGINVAILQNGTNVSTADTLIWVVRKGERFVQR